MASFPVRAGTEEGGNSDPLGGHDPDPVGTSCIVPLRGIRLAQLILSTANAVNTASFAYTLWLTRPSCLQLKMIVVVCVNAAESWTETDILSPPSWFVARRLTLVTSEPVLSVQDAGPRTVSMFRSQVLTPLTYSPGGTVTETALTLASADVSHTG